MIEYTKEWLEEACKTSASLGEIIKKSGRSKCGYAYKILKQKIKEYDIDTSHFLQANGRSSKYTFDNVFCQDAAVSQKLVRDYAIRYNIIEYKCQHCGNIGSWQDQILPLQLHHINGDNTDNRVQNLQFLCPNCHCITDNWGGYKNKDSSPY